MNEKKFHWRSSISWKSVDQITCRGYDVIELAERISFPDMMFVLFQNRIPSLNEEKMLQFVMVIFTEHSFSPSTVTARMAAVGRPPLNAAIAAGLLTFGDAHGPGQVYSEMMTSYLSRGKKAGMSVEAIAALLVEEYSRTEHRIPGLNQPQHVDGDPRSNSVFAKAKELDVAGPFVLLQQEIERAFQTFTGRKLRSNILGAAGSVLLDLGFDPKACWAIGMLCRAFSCAAHAIEEMDTESPWRASTKSGEDFINLLDLELQGEKYYSGPQRRTVPLRSDRTHFRQSQEHSSDT